MRRSNSALPARDACRAWLQPVPQQQRRVLSSAAAYPGFAWVGSSSASTSSSSASSPLSFLYSAASSSTVKSKASRTRRPLFAFSYSTSNPPYQLPGSNNEIDPRGVDYSLFEPEDESYTQHASTSTAVASHAESQDDFFTSAPTLDSTTLSAPTQLLVRLINDRQFDAATTVLKELQTLRSPLDQPLPIFATAALHSIRAGKKKDMLAWMRLCPGYTPGTKYLNTASSASFSIQARSVSSNFRKCFMVLLDSYGDDLRLLQQASMIAAAKGYWGVLQSTLAQILRFGVGRMPDSSVSNPEIGWEYFHRLVLANQSLRHLKDEARRKEILASSVELRGLYNLGVRTLALAGRLDDAVLWVRKRGGLNRALAHILVVEGFTLNLVCEELVKQGGGYVDVARELAEEVANGVGGKSGIAIDVDAIVARVEKESSFRAEESDYAQRSLSEVDGAIQAWLEQGDVVAAREYLLSVLRTATRVRYEDDDIPADHASNDSTFAHLPSARTLSDMQDIAHKLGTIAVTSSLTETDMHQASDDPDLGATPDSLTAEDFLRPIRTRLSSVRGGKGLWETARLYGLVKKGKWRQAAHFYIGRTGFKIPSGGITHQLVSLALDQQPPPSDNDDLHQASIRGKHWPSTHAINLMLKALTNLCVDAKDYERLRQLYTLWKESSLPTKWSSPSADLEFEQWPPSQRPSSHTFDSFVRAFGRIDIDLRSAEDKVEKQPWGSSSAMMDIVRDMTDAFHVRPSISTWTIALECLAREGRERWSTTTEVLARAVGIDTTPLTSSPDDQRATVGQPNFAPATQATYTALLRSLIRVPHADGGSMVEQAIAVRDDLLRRTLDLDVATRPYVLADDSTDSFWVDLLERWQTVQQSTLSRQDLRQRWDAQAVLNGNQGRTLEALREVWLLETASRESDDGN